MRKQNDSQRNLHGYLQEKLESPKSCSGYNLESALSFTDIKTVDSCSSPSYEDDSRTTLTTEESNADTSTSTDDVEMIDKFTDSVSLVPLFASS
ncbi:hypothetical protein JHK85_055039 [Glycine max]|nr:hypothetical protein JHK85_055039 [Glycine max]